MITTSLCPSGEKLRPITAGAPSNGSCATFPLIAPVFGFTRVSHTHTIGGPVVDPTWPVATRCISGCIAMHLMSLSCPWKKYCLWMCRSNTIPTAAV